MVPIVIKETQWAWKCCFREGFFKEPLEPRHEEWKDTGHAKKLSARESSVCLEDEKVLSMAGK